MKDLSEVQDRIDSHSARVYTASEFKAMVRAGNRPSLDEVDVVTCGTFGVMSGTMAILTIPVSEPGEFVRADTISINGVRGAVGPCPNESLGMADCIIYGTTRRDDAYGGGHLFRDLVSDRSVDVRVLSDGFEYQSEVTLDEIPFARMVTTRSAFKNYTCFVNGSRGVQETIFSGPKGLGGRLSEASVSGCGEINPLQNDPGMSYLNAGASVLLNGAPGMVIGTGTRSTSAKPNLSLVADMHDMRPEYMGGFVTSAGPECMTSVATAIPILSEDMLDAVSVLDEDILLPLADVSDRKPVDKTDYSSIWGGTDLVVSEDRVRCIHCSDCIADLNCPVGAHPSGIIDRSLCVSCGSCVSSCIGKVFGAELGSVKFSGTDVPVIIRQSSRHLAELLCVSLKEEVERGNWKLRC